MIFPRRLSVETLDHLPESDPRAIGSRRDLQRINRIMGAVPIFLDALEQHAPPPRRIIELGAGDGTLMLRLARRLAPLWPDVHLTLLDRQNVISPATHHAFSELGWTIELLNVDVNDWMRQPSAERWDIGFANLFIHHFDTQGIALLFDVLAQRTNAFIACEPRRAALPLLASRMIGLIGANAVTREDAVLSVEAGFEGKELSAQWPRNNAGWRLEERRARLFSHLFIAVRETHRHH